MGFYGCKAKEKSGLSPTVVAQFGHVFLYMPLYVAKEKGFFEEEGLDVSFVSTGGDDKTYAAVTSGSAQFGVADPVFVAIAREQGSDGRVVASLVNRVAFWGITYDPKISTIDTSAKWRGLRVATYPSPSTNFAVMSRTLQEAGGGNSSIVQGAFGTLIASLKAGRADVAMELEPVVSIAVRDGAHIVYSAAQRAGEFAFTGITVKADFLLSSPAKVTSFIRALSRGMALMHEDFDQCVAIAIKEFPEVDSLVIRKALQRLVKEGAVPRSPVMSPEAWKNAVSLRLQMGDLRQLATFSANVDTTIAASVSLPKR